MQYKLKLDTMPSVRLVGKTNYPEGWHKNTVHRSNVFLYMKKGEFVFDLADRSVTLHDNELLLFPAGTKYMITAKASCDYVYLHFSPLSRLSVNESDTSLVNDNEVLLPEKISFSDNPEKRERLMRHITRCENASLASDTYADLRLSSEMTSFILFVATCHSEKNTPRLPHSLIRICDYVNEHISDNITLASISDLTGLSKQYIMRLFKKHMGETVTHYVNSAKLSYAQRLLRESDRNIEEITYELGFCGSYYFCRLFKKHYGMTPSEYRTQSKEEL